MKTITVEIKLTKEQHEDVKEYADFWRLSIKDVLVKQTLSGVTNLVQAKEIYGGENEKEKT